MSNFIFNFINKIKINLFPFYKDKDLQFVFKKLQEGYPDETTTARFVGGCVRKHLKREKIDDIDVATVLSSKEIKEKFKNTNFKVLETGIKHGTVTLINKKFKIELTTLRKDVKTDGRHAQVEYIDNWQLDSERRDFTINAIYLGIDGKIFDPQLGTYDLNNRNVKFIGDPNTRIEEDYLRIIRLLRFAIQYDSSNDKTTIDALKFNLLGLKKISKERIFNELMKILSLKNFDNILKHKNKLEIFLKIFPELSNIHRLKKLKKINNTIEIKNTNLLAILLLDHTDNHEYFLFKYKASKKLAETFSKYHEGFNLIKNTKFFFKNDLRKNIYYFGKECLIFLNILQFCNNPNFDIDEYYRINKMIINCEVPKFKYDGVYLKSKGFSEGPKLGLVLKKVEDEWIKNNFEISTKKVNEIIKAND